MYCRDKIESTSDLITSAGCRVQERLTSAGSIVQYTVDACTVRVTRRKLLMLVCYAEETFRHPMKISICGMKRSNCNHSN